MTTEHDLHPHERCFTPAVGSRRWRIAESLRRLVDFQSLNLIDPVWPIEGQFDVILCRNVLMYLEANRRSVMLERLASVLATDGLLILDPAEHLGRGTGGVYPGDSLACNWPPSVRC